MIQRWRVLPEATAAGKLFGSFLEQPEEVQRRAQELPEGSPFALFVTDERVGLTSRGRAFSVPRASASVTLETRLPARGSGGYTLLIAGTRVARWYPGDRSKAQVRAIADALAGALDGTVEEVDRGRDD